MIAPTLRRYGCQGSRGCFRLPDDEYSVSLNGGVTVYGGVARWAVSGDVVSIRFRPDAARVLGLPEESNLVLALEGSDLRSVHQGRPASWPMRLTAAGIGVGVGIGVGLLTGSPGFGAALGYGSLRRSSPTPSTAS